jgi:hypothetical protein
MQQLKLLFKPACICFIVAATFLSCKPTIALYDANAYSQAISIKVDLDNLADTSATVDYTTALPLINEVTAEVQKAMEYNNGREKNTESTQQYQLLLSNFLNPFLSRWKTQTRISAASVPEYKMNFEKAMDYIIKLENGKNKS